MTYCLIALSVLGGFVIIRMILGPTIWDRLLAFNQLSAKVVIGMVFFSLMSHQTFILDIAIVYTLFSFISSVFIARFIRERGVF